MAPRRRLENKHLPERVYYKHSAYYFVNKDNKWIKLAKTLPEAMVEWAKLIEQPRSIYTMNHLFDRYMHEVAPKKSKRSYENNIHQVKTLREVFGELMPENISPVHIYKYLDLRGEKAPVAANREKELLSHVFSMAIRWGVLSDNPCKKVKSLSIAKRDKYIEDWEFIAVYKLASTSMKCLMQLAYITALRRGDILNIRIRNITEDGIHVRISKTNNKILIEWTEQLRSLIESQIKNRPNVTSEYLICTTQGNFYSKNAIDSAWQRLMNKALQMKVINERFAFRDIRRKSATDAENLKGREYARSLLVHTTQKMTEHYISGIQKVQPLVTDLLDLFSLESL